MALSSTSHFHLHKNARDFELMFSSKLDNTRLDHPTIKILVVEDEAIVAEDLASRLEKMGYIVVGIVASGEEAIALATITHPHLVLMDIMLQGEIDGIEASHQIRRELKTPVVYLTAYADDNTLQRAKVTSPSGYILKPFQEQELRATIEIALWRYQVEVEAIQALAKAQALQQEAQVLTHRKSQYISMAAHEFRNPLNLIKVVAAFLKDDAEECSEEERQHYLQCIGTAADSINQLIEEVITLGRADSGKVKFQPIPLNIVRFCQDLVEDLKMSVDERYTLKFSSSGDCTAVCLDEQLLWHILNNLLSNAIKYSPHGGHISLTLSYQDEEICFQVQDQGIGISKEDQQSLFEPFQRARNVGKIPGTGLGLAIAKQCVEVHRGQIEVDSEVGQGTTFTVTLPLKD